MSSASSGGEWTLLSEEVTDSCYVAKDLPRGASYVFRVGCITKAGAGPFSDASAPVVMATHPEGKKSTACLWHILVVLSEARLNIGGSVT